MFHALGIALPSSSYSLYAPLSRLAVTLNGPSQLGPSFLAWESFLASPYEVTWLNLCVVSPCYSDLGGLFLYPSHFLDFSYCLKLYPHVFIILLLLEQQSPCQWFPNFNEDHGVCPICESIKSFIGRCLG